VRHNEKYPVGVLRAARNWTSMWPLQLKKLNVELTELTPEQAA